MKKPIFILLAFVLGCASVSRKPSSVGTFPADQKMQFQDVRTMVLEDKIASIESALPAVTSRFPEYFKFHTLMYSSFSLHGSSFEEPRAIVFGPEAKFIFTFNGGTHQSGGNAIETLEFDSASQSFKFREIAFKGPTFSREELNLESSEIDIETPQVVISKANPQKCLACHGANASPIWGTYFVWPGAYGSNDDQLSMSFDRSAWNPNNQNFFEASDRPQSLGRVLKLKAGKPDKELDGFIRYATKHQTHPRYKYLPQAFAEPGALRYAKGGVSFKELDDSARAYDERNRYGMDYEWPSRPNSFLLTRLANLNELRILARLKQENLAGAMKSDDWAEIRDWQFMHKTPFALPLYANKLTAALRKLPFKGRPPTFAQVQAALTKNFKDEFNYQLEKISAIDFSFGRNAIELYPMQATSIVDGKTVIEYLNYKSIGSSYIDKPDQFYARLIGRPITSDIGKVTSQIETDDLVMNTAVELFLKDRGINLIDYTITARQSALTFHTGGFDEALSYLTGE